MKRTHSFIQFLFLAQLSLVAMPAISLAGSFEQDLLYFREALKNAKVADDVVLDFQDPRQGESEVRLNEHRAPWAGNFFAMKNGGIAFRWQAPWLGPLTPEMIPTQEKALQMTPEQIDRLSPIEKYDLLVGDYNFSGTRHELKRRGPWRDLKPQSWEGFCNGCRAAGILLPEPERQVVLPNPDGVRVSFQIADLKALASASFFYVEKYAQLGGPTRVGRGERQPNPAVVDLALRYFVGKSKRPFIVDSHLGREIWNETVIGYRRYPKTLKLSSDERSLYPWAVMKMRVSLMVETLGEIGIRDSDRSTQKDVAHGQRSKWISTGYDLFLDAEGKARDGIWRNAPGERGIDFIWFPSGKGTDAAHFEKGTGNPWIQFEKIKELFRFSVGRVRCSMLFGK